MTQLMVMIVEAILATAPMDKFEPVLLESTPSRSKKAILAFSSTAAWNREDLSQTSIMSKPEY